MSSAKRSCIAESRARNSPGSASANEQAERQQPRSSPARFVRTMRAVAIETLRYRGRCSTCARIDTCKLQWLADIAIHRHDVAVTAYGSHPVTRNVKHTGTDAEARPFASRIVNRSWHTSVALIRRATTLPRVIVSTRTCSVLAARVDLEHRFRVRVEVRMVEVPPPLMIAVPPGGTLTRSPTCTDDASPFRMDQCSPRRHIYRTSPMHKQTRHIGKFFQNPTILSQESTK